MQHAAGVWWRLHSCTTAHADNAVGRIIFDNSRTGLSAFVDFAGANVKICNR